MSDSVVDLEAANQQVLSSESETKNTMSKPRKNTVFMWSVLVILTCISLFLLVDVFFLSNELKKDSINYSSSSGLPSNPVGQPEIVVAGQNFAVVDKANVELSDFDVSSFKTVSIPGRIKRFGKSLIDRVWKAMSRREIQMSSKVSLIITFVSILVIIGCTGLAIYTGFSNQPIVDVGDIHLAKRLLFYASFFFSTLTVVLMVFSIYLTPDNSYLQIITFVVALMAVVAITGAMLTELIYKAQATVYVDVMNTDVSRFGLWLTHFGLGGVMAFAMGVFGCFVVIFGVEVILYRVKNTWQEPILMSIALPISMVYSLGQKHLSFFQKLLKLALLIRLVLWGLSYILPHLAAI